MMLCCMDSCSAQEPIEWLRGLKDNNGDMQGWGPRRLSVLDYLNGHLCCEVD